MPTRPSLRRLCKRKISSGRAATANARDWRTDTWSVTGRPRSPRMPAGPQQLPKQRHRRHLECHAEPQPGRVHASSATPTRRHCCTASSTLVHSAVYTKPALPPSNVHICALCAWPSPRRPLTRLDGQAKAAEAGDVAVQQVDRRPRDGGAGECAAHAACDGGAVLAVDRQSVSRGSAHIQPTPPRTHRGAPCRPSLRGQSRTWLLRVL